MKRDGPRILVIEDDPARTEALADLVQGEGWSFYEASTIEEARAAAGDLGPEVIVLDPAAQQGQAVTLLVELRRDSVWAPIVLYTSDPRLDQAWALEHGAAARVGQSDAPAQLKDAIAALLDDSRTDRPL